MEDFSAWLAAAAAESDYVVVSMDLGSGREFPLLQRLVQVCHVDQSLEPTKARMPRRGRSIPHNLE